MPDNQTGIRTGRPRPPRHRPEQRRNPEQTHSGPDPNTRGRGFRTPSQQPAADEGARVEAWRQSRRNGTGHGLTAVPYGWTRS